jgi:hemerythrin-like domain-containing protein
MQPLHVLKHEHRVIEKALRALEGVCRRLAVGEPVPREVPIRLVDFITEFADRYHHGKEENYLFPALHRQGIVGHDSALSIIVHEHEIEKTLTDKMREAILEYQSAEEESRKRFVEAAVAYINHLTGHILKEDAILFRVANELLDETDLDDLMAGFERARTEFGPELSDQYEKTATELEQAWAE